MEPNKTATWDADELPPRKHEDLAMVTSEIACQKTKKSKNKIAMSNGIKGMPSNWTCGFY